MSVSTSIHGMPNFDILDSAEGLIDSTLEDGLDLYTLNVYRRGCREEKRAPLWTTLRIQVQ